MGRQESREARWEEEDNAAPLPAEDASRYRALAARANYLAADRTDLLYSVKEICRSMSSPTVGSWKKLKRLGRYLQGQPRSPTQYAWQGGDEQVLRYSDSDWAGCRVTGQYTSGGVVMVGTRFTKGWARTQNHVTVSSAAAEIMP